MNLRAFVLAAIAFTSAPALASNGMCPKESDHIRLEAFRDRVAAAETPEAAKEMAFRQTRLGHEAIRRASRVLPKDAGIADALGRLDAFDAGVAASTSQQEVAGQFDALLLQNAAGGSCDYTTTEIVVTIIGFVLGIIPGILFLFLFC